MHNNIALPIDSGSRVTTLDFAEKLSVAEVRQGNVVKKETVSINETFPAIRAGKLKQLEIGTILCGAVSDTLSMIIWHHGIEIVSGLAGFDDELLSAYLTRDLGRFKVPDFHPSFRGGCCRHGKRRRWHGHHGNHRE